MKKFLCKDCMQKEYEIQPDENSLFPFFSVLGILGSAFAFLSGNLFLVPIALIAGFGTDVLRCELCCSNENIHQLMRSEEVNQEKIYRPLLDFSEKGDDPDSFWSTEPEPPLSQKYQFDQAEKKLIPVEENCSQEMSDPVQSELAWSHSPSHAKEKSADVIDNTVSENISPGLSGDGEGTGNLQGGINPNTGGSPGEGGGTPGPASSGGGE